MKYVSRGACDGRGALGGVLKEVELLSSLEHPFLVNLWFSFQGEYNINRDMENILYSDVMFSFRKLLLLHHSAIHFDKLT